MNTFYLITLGIHIAAGSIALFCGMFAVVTCNPSAAMGALGLRM